VQEVYRNFCVKLLDKNQYAFILLKVFLVVACF